jgi:hypothetical protein
MIIPTVLILLPAIAALIVFMWLYYELDPVKRVTDLRMLLAFICFLVMAGYMFVIIQGYDRTVPSMVFCVLAMALLIVSVHMRRRQPFLNPRKRR